MRREGEPSVSSPGRRLRVLVVDDESDLREALEELLTSEGYEVSTAAGGREALDRIALSAPDLLLLDWVMPKVDGHDVLCALADRYAKRPFTVVVMSAGSFKVISQKQPNGDSFIRKPFDLGELLNLVHRHAETREQAS